jgi:hypothetical protein
MKIKSANEIMIFPKILKVENSNANSYPNFALAKLSYIDKINGSNKWQVFSSFIYKNDLNLNDGHCEQIIFKACKRIINEKELFDKKLIILDIHTPLSMCEFGKNCYRSGQDFINTYADKVYEIKIRVSYNFPYCNNNPLNNDNIFQKQIQLMDYTKIKEQDIEHLAKKYSTDLIITSGGRNHFGKLIKMTNSYFPRIIYEIANEDRDEFLENSEDKTIINEALAELYSFSKNNQINYTKVLNCFVKTCYARESGYDYKGKLVYIDNFRSDLCGFLIEKLKSLTKFVENKDLSFLNELLKSCVNEIYYPGSFKFNEMKNELESINSPNTESSVVVLSGQDFALDSPQI